MGHAQPLVQRPSGAVDRGSARPSDRSRWVVAVLCACGVTASLLQTFIIPIIPDLPRLLDTTPTGASWVLTSTLLAGAVVTPISGRLADIFGKRLMLVLSLLSLGLGSVLCALTDELGVVVAGRTLQGLGLGIVPLGISVMRDVLPAARVPGGAATMSATLGVGGAVALPLGAVIADHLGWQAVFWIAALMSALCLVAVLFVVPPSPERARSSLDVPGALLLSAGLVAGLLAVTKGGEWGWGSTPVAGLAVGGLLVLAWWTVYELRRDEPLVDLRVSASPVVRNTNLAGLMLGFGMYVLPLTFPQILVAPLSSGYGLDRSVADIGWVLAPGGVAMMVAGPSSVRLSRLYGPRVTLVLGGAASMLGYLLAIVLPYSVWSLMAATIVANAGIAFAYAAMPLLIMGAVPVTQTGAANGLNALMRGIGLTVAGAVVSAVLAASTVAGLPTAGALRAALMLGVLSGVLGIVFALLVPRGHVSQQVS